MMMATARPAPAIAALLSLAALLGRANPADIYPDAHEGTAATTDLDGWDQYADRPRHRRGEHHLHIPPAEPRPLADAVAEDVLWTVHQTNRVVSNLPAEQLEWQHSWRQQGFKVLLLGDDECREDIKRLSELLEREDYLTIYDSLESPVQRADFWRYARLYLEGGIYADVDVVARPQIRPLLKSFFCDKCSREGDGVVFVESVGWATGAVAFLLLYFKMTDMVRLPQLRQCILIAGRPKHPLYKLTLDMIVDGFADGEWRTRTGLARTLLLTGPGVFTDAVNRYRSEHAHANIAYISRHAGHQHFSHLGAGSWKPPKMSGDWMKETTGLAVALQLAWIVFFVAPCLALGWNRRWRLKLWNLLFEWRIVRSMVGGGRSSLSSSRRRADSFSRKTESFSRK